MYQLACDTPELPTLGRGIHRLDTPDRTVGPLQSLVLDHLLFHDGPAYWVDARGQATTQPLARLAPSPRILDRIQVARGFTAFQHYTLVERLAAQVAHASLVVVPAIDVLYRADDLASGEPRRLLDGVTDTLTALTERVDCPVLVTCHRADALTTVVDDVVEHELACESTRFGPRFVGDEFETLVYRTGGQLQTTLTYWERVLAHRFEHHRQRQCIPGAA